MPFKLGALLIKLMSIVNSKMFGHKSSLLSHMPAEHISWWNCRMNKRRHRWSALINLLQDYPVQKLHSAPTWPFSLWLSKRLGKLSYCFFLKKETWQIILLLFFFKKVLSIDPWMISNSKLNLKGCTLGYWWNIRLTAKICQRDRLPVAISVLRLTIGGRIEPF